MLRFATIATICSVLALSVSTSALAGPLVFSTQDVSSSVDPNFTELLGVNNAGTIAGFSGAASAQGFTLTLPGTYSTENFPGTLQTRVSGINGAGSTVGSYVDAAGFTHGFTRNGVGVFTTIDDPATTVFNSTLGINSANSTVGYYASNQAGVTGRTANRQSGGAFTNLGGLLPANVGSEAAGINDAGAIVGFYQPTATTAIGFLYVGGVISNVGPAGSQFTEALGISNTGEIVGVYVDAGGTQHGYVDIGGMFTTFDPLGSLSTTISGVNDLGEIVGYYTNADDKVIGFVGTPISTQTPEPTSLGLIFAGLLVAGVGRLRRVA